MNPRAFGGARAGADHERGGDVTDGDTGEQMAHFVKKNSSKLNGEKGEDKETDTKNRRFDSNEEKNGPRAIAQKNEEPRPMSFQSASHSDQARRIMMGRV